MATSRSRARRNSTSSNGRKGSGGSSGPQAAQEQLRQAVQQVWLAGMGAIARAQKDGPAAFQDAVTEGLKLFGQTGTTAQRRVRDVVGAAQETLQARVGGAREQAQETWDNLEALFQSRVQRAMHQLGVPTAEEIRELSRRVAELNDSVMESAQPKRRTPRKKAKAKAPAASRRAKATAPRRAKSKRPAR
jgi:poly(hydroxyalkanoate) granule-associated protein